MKTLDQIRAKYAWNCVQGANDKYKNLAKSLPALVMTNGLMQTLAFLKGKANSNSEHERLMINILGWLGRPEAQVLTQHESSDYARAMQALAASDSPRNQRAIEVAYATAMQALAASESPGYQRATEEALAILKWIRYLAPTVSS